MSDNVSENKGGISVQMEHLFPVIKKWLYSEKEIFLREIVSNACDADTKLKRLVSLGEVKNVDTDKLEIRVILDADAKTITVVDNGIGMDEEELRRYLCQVALSGALEFIEKYEGKDADSTSDGIIGHFGLGFYSSFMISDTVDVYTRSCTMAPPVKWTCSSDGDWEIGDGDEVASELFDERGTAVVMHVGEEGEEFLSETKIRDVLEKYCAFMPIPIYFEVEGKEAEKDKDGNEKAPEPINDTNPLWLKAPGDCTDEEYSAFYRKVFSDYRETLFHVHLRADYPLNFKGILYFPKISSEFDNLEGQVKLYYNQVFVADNIKEVIPDYLLMLRGVIDCPELPLNVSRSYLQNSGYVTKIAAHITKKVADKINSMFSDDRESFEKMWNDVKVFVRYASIRDKKFAERVKDAALFEKTDGSFVTLAEYLDAAKETNDKKVYYTTDKAGQSAYIKMLTDQGIDVIEMNGVLDTQYMQSLETENEGVKFLRVDSEVADAVAEGDAQADEELTSLFSKFGPKDMTVEYKTFKNAETPAILTVSEDERRFGDMMKLYSMGKDMPEMPMKQTLVVNTACPIIDKIKNAEGEKKDTMAKYVYSLAKLSSRKLSADELGEFLADSYKIISEL
jgi:molecular chaperone HtpG